MAIDWITLNEQGLQATLAGPELAAYKTAATAVGQANPVLEIIEQVVAEVAGFIAASDNPVTPPAGQVPRNLARASYAIVRYRLITRLPINAQTMLEHRLREYDDALAMLRAVARGDFVIGTPDASTSAGDVRAKYGSATRVFDDN